MASREEMTDSEPTPRFVKATGSPVSVGHRDRAARIGEAVVDLRLVIDGFVAQPPSLFSDAVASLARHCSIFLRKMVLGPVSRRPTCSRLTKTGFALTVDLPCLLAAGSNPCHTESGPRGNSPDPHRSGGVEDDATGRLPSCDGLASSPDRLEAHVSKPSVALPPLKSRQSSRKFAVRYVRAYQP